MQLSLQHTPMTIFPMVDLTAKFKGNKGTRAPNDRGKTIFSQ